MAKNTYNKIYTKEKWDKVNSYNKQILDDYILQAKSEGKSEDSLKQYYNDGRIIMILIMELFNNKPLHKFTRKMARNLILHFKELNQSPARINRLLSTFRTIFVFCSEDDEFEEDFEDCKLNPSRVKGLKKEEKREIVFLTDEEIFIIYEELKAQKRYSEALLCVFMYESCSRRNEVYQVKRSDISIDSNIAKSFITGKRGKRYRPVYNDNTKEAFSLLEENRADDYDCLWLTKANVPASYETLYAWVISWRKILESKTGIYKEFNAHSWRHSCANNLENGTHYLCRKVRTKFELTQIQKLMNHTDLSTTHSYIEDRSEEEILATFCV